MDFHQFFNTKWSQVSSVADSHHVNADPDPTFHFDADADPEPAFHSDADPDPTFQFNADPSLFSRYGPSNAPK
jgi:hypothetical protein